MTSKKVVILGFGFSGLSAAWAYLRQGFEVEVFEKSNQPGGLLQTKKTEFGLVEIAANAILKSANVEAMAKDFSIHWAERKNTAKFKWVYTDQPRRWPLNLNQTLKSTVPMFKFMRGYESVKPKPMESLKTWGLRVFGNEDFVSLLLGPALQGVYAQGPEDLSASLSLKTFFSSQRIHHVGSHAPLNGMSDFFESGLKYLTQNPKFKIHFNSSVEIKNCDGPLVIDTRPDYQKVKYLSVTSVTLFFETKDRPSFKGFGCLFAKSKTILGVLFNSDIFEGRSTEGLFSETWILSHDYKDDRDTVDEVLSFREKKFGISAQPSFYSVTPWPRGIPNYNLQHERFLQNDFKFESVVEGRKVLKIANYTGDIGLNKILEKLVVP